MGRPSSYSEAIGSEICERLADGDSLRSICSEPGFPDMRTVRRWLDQNETFRLQYARARERQADAYADRILDEAYSAEDASLGRLRMDALKWAASKLAPKRYGDAVQMKHTDADGGPVQQVIRWANDQAEATHDPSRS